MELPKRKQLHLENYDDSSNGAYFVTICTCEKKQLFSNGAGAPLPEIIKWFKTQTTNAYISGVRSGQFLPFRKQVWQRNYYEHVIRNEQDLCYARNYIVENPPKWTENENYSPE